MAVALVDPVQLLDKYLKWTESGPWYYVISIIGYGSGRRSLGRWEKIFLKTGLENFFPSAPACRW